MERRETDEEDMKLYGEEVGKDGREEAESWPKDVLQRGCFAGQ